MIHQFTFQSGGLMLISYLHYNHTCGPELFKYYETFEDTTSGTYPLPFVTQIFQNGQPSHGGDRKTFEVMPST